MFKFFNDSDRQYYEELKSCYDRIIATACELGYPLERYKKDLIEVDEHNDIRCFHHPTSLRWIRFYGTWDELHDKLATDFKYWYPNVQFYIAPMVSPIQF